MTEARELPSPVALRTEGAPTPRVDSTIDVLLVEDDVVDRMAFERAVAREALPYRCTMADSLAEARRWLAEQSFDIILTDVNLGDGSGLDLLALAPDKPVVVITGAGDEETAVEAMRAGAYDYLTKDTGGRYLKMVPVTIEKARRNHAAKQRARMLQQAVTRINDAVYVTDLDGCFIFVNPSFCRTYGWSEEAILGQLEEVLWSDTGDQDLLPCRPFGISRGGEHGECRHRRADGMVLPVLISRSVIVDELDRAVAAVCAVRDISERTTWESALRESEQRFALAAAGANDGLWDWDLRRGQVYYSGRWKTILGFDDETIDDRPEVWTERIHPDDRPLFEAQLDAHLRGHTPHFENEHRLKVATGSYRWMQVRGLAVRDDQRGATRVAGSLRDITEHKEAEERLTHAALHDALTGLPNRALFMDRLGRALERLRRHGDEHAFAVVFLDLDRFKVINDSLGHLAGDELLTAIAHRLASCLRQIDTVARLSGDEFAILLEELGDSSRAEQVVERIHQALEAPFRIHDHEIFTAASLGVAHGHRGYERPEDVLRDADTAMYRAKSEGTSRRVVFDPGMHERAVALLHLESDLRRAVEQGEFELYYQPIVSLEDGSLDGFEALIRWRHERRGLVSPDDFLPLARETGLAPRIGWWVLREACRRLAKWRRLFPAAAGLSVSVNLDGEQLSSHELVEHVERALMETQLPAECLKLEITEGMIIENPELAAATLERLRRDGVGFYIDDFGTGYSSLSQLYRFPVDALKIDRSFVGALTVAPAGSERPEQGQAAIVRTIVDLAHNLGLEARGEGVEQREQLDFLRDLGCSHAQGYYFSRPLPVSGAEKLLAEDRLVFFDSPDVPRTHES